MRARAWGGRAGAAALAYAAAIVVIYSLAQAIPAPDDNPPPAAVIVFYDDGDSMRRARVKAASGRALMSGARLIAAGGWRPERRYNGAAVMAAEAEAFGVPRARIAHDSGSNDSVSNLGNAVSLLAGAGPGPVELVSDRYHLLRLGLLAKSLNGRIARLVPAKAELSGLDTFRRLNHELAAYTALLLPRAWMEALLARSRA